MMPTGVLLRVKPDWRVSGSQNGDLGEGDVKRKSIPWDRKNGGMRLTLLEMTRGEDKVVRAMTRIECARVIEVVVVVAA